MARKYVRRCAAVKKSPGMSFCASRPTQQGISKESDNELPTPKSVAFVAGDVVPTAYPRSRATRVRREMGSPQAAHRTRAGAWLGAEGQQPQSPMRGMAAARMLPRKGAQDADRESGARAKGQRTGNAVSRAGRSELGGSDIACKDNGAPSQTTRECTRQAGARAVKLFRVTGRKVGPACIQRTGMSNTSGSRKVYPR